MKRKHHGRWSSREFRHLGLFALFSARPAAADKHGGLVVQLARASVLGRDLPLQELG
jgi:hypothetical protein